MSQPGEVTVLGGRYRLLRRLGQGGHAEVFLAEQRSLQRKVALKIISRTRAQADAAARFKREALIHSSIDHPSVVRILDFETDGPDGTVVVLEYVDGQRLDEVIAARQVPVPEAGRMLLQLAEGLAAIHAKGVVHRDFKAENVMVTETHARILDFGLARFFETPVTDENGRAFVTAGELVAGTPAYLAPEQFRGDPATPRTDVYSFGVTAHFLLAGSLPFPGPDIGHYAGQHQQQPPPSLRGRVPEVLAAFVERCLEKDAAKRPADGMSLAAQLYAMQPQLTAQVVPKKKSRAGWLLVPVSLLIASAPFIAVECDASSRARWLIRVGLPDLAEIPPGDFATEALKLHAQGLHGALREMIEVKCIETLANLDEAERRRLGVSLQQCFRNQPL
ncbi:MAG: serine/threonine-protein kinase [Archangium sp.]